MVYRSRTSSSTRRHRRNNTSSDKLIDESMIEQASKALQHELYLLHKKPVSAKHRREFIALFKKIVEIAYPHIHQQKEALCMLDNTLCNRDLTIRQMCADIYNNRENTEKLFGRSIQTESHFSVWIRSGVFAIITYMLFRKAKPTSSKNTKKNGIFENLIGIIVSSLSATASFALGRLNYSVRNTQLMNMTKKASIQNQKKYIRNT